MGLLALACVALAAGCGSSDSEETLTKAEFVKQAGAICEKSQEERGKAVAAVAENANPKGNVQKQQEQVIRKALPTYEEAARQIEELGAPEGQEEKVEALVEAMDEAAERAMADPHTAMTSNIFFREADKLAEEYKLSGCII
jgi:hypothetical protein